MLASYLGLVSAALSAFGGGWLLLAPYALDYRRGAPGRPVAADIDLATGAAVVAIAAVTVALFLRALRPAREARPSQPSRPPHPAEAVAPAPPEPEPERTAPADPADSLRDLLTPLVAALAADLRGRSADGAREWQIPGQT